MVKGTLVDSLIKSGRKYVEILDEAGLSPRAALWLYRSEPDEWSLVLALDVAERKGSRAAYSDLLGVFQSHAAELSPLKFEDITAVPPTTPIVQTIGKLIRVGPKIGGVRITNNLINGALIEDAWVYRTHSLGNGHSTLDARSGAA